MAFPYGRGMLPSLLSWAVAAPLVSTEVVSDGPLRRRLVDDDADVVLVLASEQRGRPGPCGCSLEPLGGLMRLRTYTEALRRRNPDTPVVVVNAGGLLGRTDRESDAAMVASSEGLWDAVLASWTDATPTLVSTASLPWVAAARPEVPDVRRLSTERVTVVVTGVSAPPIGGPDPVASLGDVGLVSEELVVVLAYDVAKRIPDLIALEHVDVVVEAGGFRARYGPFTDDDTVWVRSWLETPVLGELRLWLDHGSVTRALHRWVRLDDRLEPRLK